MIEAAIIAAVGLISYWFGYGQGKKAGLHAPLSTRQAALRAELERATGAFGKPMPTVHRVGLKRRGKRERSNKSG